MLCLPGFTPVAKLDQAVGDSEGCVEPSREKTPSPASAFRFGSLPSSMNFCASVGSMPSNPITNTRCLVRRSGLPPSGPLRQATSERREEDSGREEGQARRRNGATPERRMSGETVYPTARDGWYLKRAEPVALARGPRSKTPWGRCRGSGARLDPTVALG